jgi:hypothetical protein
MTTPAWNGDGRPGHDPVAEDMDILTHQEAAARLYDQVEDLRAEADRLTASGDNADQLPAVLERLALLERTIERLSPRHRASPLHL